tara:strand:+ start:34953 stop:35885 length:933 start_codon:yes stop_codon:yes gene_type:complete
MRYSKEEAVLKLATAFQADEDGLSLLDIQDMFEVSRRTAERMRDVVARVFNGLDEIKEGRNKRWRLRSENLSGLINLTADEVSSLHTAKTLCKQNNMHDVSSKLDVLISKLRAIEPIDRKRRIDPDLEALLEAEGLAMRPGPRLKLNLEHASYIRESIKASVELKILYKSLREDKANWRTLQPLGILYGAQNYLIAIDISKNEIRTYKMGSIEACELTSKVFNRPDSFCFKKYNQNSFGVFQEDPYDVVWKFSKSAAENAKEYEFHPTQIFEEQGDGSLIVKFRAGGRKEMDWHLYTWGRDVEDLTNYKI